MFFLLELTSHSDHGEKIFVQKHSDQAASSLNSNNELSWLKMNWKEKASARNYFAGINLLFRVVDFFTR